MIFSIFVNFRPKIWRATLKALFIVNPLPDTSILDQVKLQIKIWCQKYEQMRIQLSDLVENIVGKGEIACYEQFLLFPQCFQKQGSHVAQW